MKSFTFQNRDGHVVYINGAEVNAITITPRTVRIVFKNNDVVQECLALDDMELLQECIVCLMDEEH